MAVGWPRQDNDWITTEQFFRFHKNKLDEMLCNLDSTEYARSFEPNPTLLLSASLIRSTISRKPPEEY